MLESKMGKILNSCLDAGIKAVCPNIIDDELIEIKDAVIENLHNLIKNNDGKFELSEEELELAKKLC